MERKPDAQVYVEKYLWYAHQGYHEYDARLNRYPGQVDHSFDVGLMVGAMDGYCREARHLEQILARL